MENTTDLDTFHCGPRQYPDAAIGRIEPAGAREKKRLTTGTRRLTPRSVFTDRLGQIHR